MSLEENNNYTENVEARAKQAAEYFTSKPAEQIVLGLLSTAKKTDDLEIWARLDNYVRELEGIIFQAEYRPNEVY
jgi:hypothetical protein